MNQQNAQNNNKNNASLGKKNSNANVLSVLCIYALTSHLICEVGEVNKDKNITTRQQTHHIPVQTVIQ